MKNKSLLITLIILLAIIVFLLVIFLVMSLNGKTNFKNAMFSIGSTSTNIIYDNQFDLEKIKKIDIKQDAGDIIIKESENDSIKVVLYGENEEDAQVELNNGNLTINNKHSRKNYGLFNIGNIKNDIILYVPSYYSNEININNDYGKCEAIDLESATLNIDCDYGNVELGKIKNAFIKCDYGNIEVEQILNKCNIKADCGNVEIDTISIIENSNIKSDCGNIEINNTNDIYIDAEVDLGKTKINKNNRNAEIVLKTECDCGNITINN